MIFLWFFLKTNVMQDLTANNNSISTESDMVRLVASFVVYVVLFLF